MAGFHVSTEAKETSVYDLLRGILEGNDRSILINSGRVPLSISRFQIVSTAPSDVT
jgi:hypothetical protein